ncbi:hypothetical protein [Streptomyces sp. NPDC004788]
MDEGELAPGKKWAARGFVLLVGAAVTVSGVLLAVRLWGEAGVGMGFGGEPGRFVATACTKEGGGRGGPRTVCTGTFTSDDGRTVARGSMSSPGADSMAVGDAFDVRRGGDGTCVRVGVTDVAGAVVSALMTTLLTLVVAVASVVLARRVGDRRTALAENGWDPFDRAVPARRPPRPPSYGYRKRRRPRR